MNMASVKKTQMFLLYFISVLIIFSIGNLKAEESKKVVTHGHSPRHFEKIRGSVRRAFDGNTHSPTRKNHGSLSLRDRIDAIKLFPISKAPTVSSLAGKASQVTDPRAAEVSARLREYITALKQDTNQYSMRAPRLTTKQKDALEQLRERLGTDVKVRLSNSGAPRQIKGNVLEQVVREVVPGSDRSEKTARTCLRSNCALLGIDDPDNELILYKRQKDRLDRRHLRFSQRYLGLPVWPADLIVHLDPAGNVDLIDGAFVPTPRNLNRKPELDAEAALKLAREEVSGGTSADVNKPQLIVYAPGNTDPRLAWKLELSVSIITNWLVVIDALTGATLTAYNQVMEAGVAGSGVDLFGNTQPVNVWEEGGTFYMVDTSKNMFDSASDPPDPKTAKGAAIILDAQNQPPDPQKEPITAVQITSTNPTTGWLADAVSASFNFSETYDYFFERHGRNSLDDQGGNILAIVRLSQNFNNAFFNPEQQLMGFGDAKPFAGALDVIAHELSHGVTFNTANLIYKDQPGALNEAFSDIFGQAAEARTEGSQDWILGDVFATPSRNFIDPSSLVYGATGGPYPSKMSEFINISEDNGGVHGNSSIINHCFYLLAEGLSGAIGLPDAEKIFYRALTTHLVANSQFIDARLACIQSAEELFGVGSAQAQKTAEAFDAVEIFDGSSTPETPPIPTVNASDSTLFLFYNNSIGSYFLGRREEVLGDNEAGVSLSGSLGVNFTRPSVSGDGSFAVFIDSMSDMCFVNTDGSSLNCIGTPGQFWSVAISPDGQILSYIMLDEFGNPENNIIVEDIRSGVSVSKTFHLVAPVLDGVSTNTIIKADAMDFSADGRFLFYDALNAIQLADGSSYGAWSIYAIDIITGQTFMIMLPELGLDIGFPSAGQASDDLITFDVVDESTNQSIVLAGNLNTGELKQVAIVNGGNGFPSYTGDDTAIVYSQVDGFTQTGFSILRQQLGADYISSSGSPTLWLSDADFGTIYRRGTFTGASPAPNIKANALDGQVTPIGNLSVTVALEPGSRLNDNADWWIAADTPFGWYYFDVDTMNWIYGGGSSYTDLSPTYQGSLFDLSTFEVLNIPVASLLPGKYTLYFAVDTNINGVLDFGELFFDSVVVNITP